MIRKFLCAAMSLMVGSAASAGLVGTTGPNPVIDRYIGGDDNGYFNNNVDSNPNDDDDSIGSSRFDINSTSASTTANSIQVTINTNFMATPKELGARIGDLFVDFDNYALYNAADAANLAAVDLANGWFGYGDDLYTGTQFGYAIRLTTTLSDIGNATSGGVELWKLDTANYAAAVLESDVFFGTSGNHRNHQEVRVDAGHAGNRQIAISGGSWTSDGSSTLTISLNADIAAAFSIVNPDNVASFAYHWGMTCGNDTVENALFYPPPSTNVPEPSTAAIFGLGLLGLGFAGRRRNNKNA